MTDAPVPKKQQPTFKILQDHRPYCAYVVRTSAIPSMPTFSPLPPNGHQRSASTGANGAAALQASAKMEGWRAVLSMVLRYGAVQRQRLGLHRVQSLPAQDTLGAEESGEMETGSVEAMVAGVKKRGVDSLADDSVR